MKEHIMHSDAVKQIKENNEDILRVVHQEIENALEPIIKKYENKKEQDVCIIMRWYIRVWNDVVTAQTGNTNMTTSFTAIDSMCSDWSFSLAMLNDNMSLNKYI